MKYLLLALMLVSCSGPDLKQYGCECIGGSSSEERNYVLLNAKSTCSANNIAKELYPGYDRIDCWEY